jgi:hypothetical protein
LNYSDFTYASQITNAVLYSLFECLVKIELKASV